YDTSVALFPHGVPDCLGPVHTAHQVHVQHGAEVVQCHSGKALVAQDAGVIDQDVDALPLLERTCGQCLHGGVVGDVAAHGNGLPAVADDLVGHPTGGRACVSPGDIVDHHARTMAGQFQGVCAPQAVARACDDGHAVL